MNAAEPVAATPTDGHTPGIVDESSSAQQISAGGVQSNTSSGGAGRRRGRRSRSQSNRGKEAAVVPDDRWFLPQFRLCRDLLRQAGVLHGQVIQPTPALLTNAGEAGQTVGLCLGKHPGVHGRLAYAKLRITHHGPPASVLTQGMKSDITTPKLMHTVI